MQSGKYCQRDFTFCFGDCDREKRGSVYAIMKLFSEMAGEDYENRGLGHAVLWEHGQTFLVTRIRLEFARLPEYAETVRALTWERCVKGPYFYRDFTVDSLEGKRILAGTSMWMLVDPTSREILRPAALFGGMPEGCDETAGCDACKRLKLKPDLPVVGERPIYYSDLDANGHVNNAVYSKIAVDFLPESVRQGGLKAIDVSFAMETKLGETLELHGGEIPGGYAVQGMVGDTLHFACEFEY